MSKTLGSGSRTRSRSASRSRSRSASRSRSRSRSSSRSRTRKHRYSSRSRSRSRSHSPSHNRERKHQRDNQNNREYRGYHRGFRRPYHFRGRGRGYFRGRFQRGGGYNNYNNRSNNWKNFRQFPQQKQHQQQHYQQQHQQLQHPLSPKRGRSRSHSPEKQLNSPHSHSHSRRSDRSSSQHSHHSSSSSSSRQRGGFVKQHCKAAGDGLSALKENQKGGGGDETLSVQDGCPQAEGSTNGDTAFIKHDSSAKEASLPVHSPAVARDQGDRATGETGQAPVGVGTSSNGSTCWQPIATALSTTSPSKKSPTTVFSDFGLFSNVDHQEEDALAISIAFRKFLEEQRNKKQTAAENGIEKGADNSCALGENSSSSLGKSKPAEHNKKRESEKGKCNEDDMPCSSSLSRPPFFCEDEEAEGDEETHLKRRNTEDAAPISKNKNTPSARVPFEEHVSKLEDIAWDEELEAFLLSRKQERAAGILAALAKRERIAHKCRDISPETPSKLKRMDKTALSPSPTYAAHTRRSSESREQEVFVSLNDQSPPRLSGVRGTEFNLRLDSLSEDLLRSSILSNDRKNAMDLTHPHVKEQEFRPVFQHLCCNNFRRSPSELFAQHVVAIVHHIKAQYFPSSGMTLNDRFAMYQRIAAEKEIMKSRKSPEIHRRIDVSPSAFKRHSLLFDELKDSVDSSFKVDGKQLKGDTMDLRLDIERRKKYLMRELNDKQEGGGESGETLESGMDRATEKSSKHHKKSKKSKKKRERSPSSSSSSSCPSCEERDESREEAFSKNQLKLRESAGPMDMGPTCGAFQFRMRSRGWNRVNTPGNNTNGSSNAYVSLHPKNEEWDPEHVSKGRRYIVQDEKDGEGESKWTEPRGRGQTCVPRVKGRFILRRPTSCSNINNSSSAWSNDKVQASGQNGVQLESNKEHNRNEQKNN